MFIELGQRVSIDIAGNVVGITRGPNGPYATIEITVNDEKKYCTAPIEVCEVLDGAHEIDLRLGKEPV